MKSTCAAIYAAFPKIITPAIKYPHAIELYSRSYIIKIYHFSRPCRGNRKIWQLLIRQFLTFLQEICGYLIAELINCHINNNGDLYRPLPR